VVLRDELPAMQGQTPYMRFGDWPILLWCALFLGIGGYLRRQNDAIVPLRSRY
jgi:apolipoprotein N-acyltransferase